ncbi:MAG: hypothetical protein V4616_05960 [Bacteroidota bacterium]
MKLILIHGRAQEGKDEKELKKEWLEALQAGFDFHDHKLTDKVNVHFLYYGDLLNTLIHDTKIKDGIIVKGAESAAALQFMQELLLEIAEEKAISIETDIHQKGILNWEWMQKVLAFADGYDSIGGFSLRQFTNDVYHYLTNGAIRRRVDEFIKGAISELGDEDCVVVAHSLGTVVAYNVLNTLSTNNVKKFLTLGSPLAVKAIKNKLSTPLKFPSCIRNGWYNAYDEKDFVSLYPLTPEYFQIGKEIVNNNKVDNPSDNHHNITGYLCDKEVAKEIYNACGPD